MSSQHKEDVYTMFPSYIVQLDIYGLYGLKYDITQNYVKMYYNGKICK